MVREALRYKQFHAAVVFSKLMYKNAQEVQSKKKKDSKSKLFGDHKINYRKAASLLATTIRLHDEALLQMGEIGLTHRCMKSLYNENITYANFSFGEQINVPELVGRSVFNEYFKENSISRSNYTIVKLGGLRQSEKLCAGSKSQVQINHFNTRTIICIYILVFRHQYAFNPM